MIIESIRQEDRLSDKCPKWAQVVITLLVPEAEPHGYLRERVSPRRLESEPRFRAAAKHIQREYLKDADDLEFVSIDIGHTSFTRYGFSQSFQFSYIEPQP